MVLQRCRGGADDEARRDIYRFGGATDLRTVPDFDRWSRPVESPCAANANAPGRVVSSISGDFPDDPSWWVGPIGTVLDLIRDKYPRTSLIVLEPVCRRARSRGVPDEPRPWIPESARD